MRVGFDTSPLERPHPPGVVRVVRETVAALEARGKIEVVRLVPPEGVKLSPWRQKTVPQRVAEDELVGVHSFVSAFPWRGPGRRVQTIHELPWKHGVKENAGWRHRAWARFGARRADAVVTPTAAVARDLGRKLAQDGGNVHVVPWGVSEEFGCEPPAGTVDELVLERYRLPEGPLALCIGAVRDKKNLAAVLRGVARLHESGDVRLHVVVTGPETADLRHDLGLVSRLGLSRYVSTPGAVEDGDLPALIRLAAVVPVLSRSEGFGLPALEATACGTPVVAPPNSAQAEAAGPDAFLADPDDPDAVARALGEAVAQREELRYVLPESVSGLTWDRTAERIEALWESLE